ncbi:MAG: alpha/beta hydrolase [Erysipelotrichaceae bacterium]|nr:alpha/beta hydrolase [Erysipelotrichaceae bacterium]
MIRNIILSVCLVLLCSGCTNQMNEGKTWIDKEMILNKSRNQKGILTLPKEKNTDAMVVLLSGSGPNDADYTIDGVGLYAELAHGLAEYGISSIRMDKRSYVCDEEIKNIQQEIIDDALLVLKKMKHKYDRVYVLGHSLSAITLPVFQADGLISLSGSMREVEEIYAFQLMKNADKQEQFQIQEELKMIQSLKEDRGFCWFGIKESYWLSLDELHLKDAWSHLNIPVLAMHGSADDIIEAKELSGYQKLLKENATCVLIDGLDHYLRAPGSLHLDDSVILQIASWILKSS